MSTNNPNPALCLPASSNQDESGHSLQDHSPPAATASDNIYSSAPQHLDGLLPPTSSHYCQSQGPDHLESTPPDIDDLFSHLPPNSSPTSNTSSEESTPWLTFQDTLNATRASTHSLHPLSTPSIGLSTSTQHHFPPDNDEMSDSDNGHGGASLSPFSSSLHMNLANSLPVPSFVTSGYQAAPPPQVQSVGYYQDADNMDSTGGSGLEQQLSASQHTQMADIITHHLSVPVTHLIQEAETPDSLEPNSPLQYTESSAMADSPSPQIPTQETPESEETESPPNQSVEDDFDPLMPSTTNPFVMGSENLDLRDFLRSWARFRSADSSSFLSSSSSRGPNEGLVRKETDRKIDEVTYDDLQGDHCDFQGLNWVSLETTRAFAKRRRRLEYTNYTNRINSDVKEENVRARWSPLPDSYFRFKRMLIRQDVNLAHFQLRSVLACTSRSQIFYPVRRGICRLNPTTKVGSLALDLGPSPSLYSPITTLDANCGVLVGGTFSGEYVLKSIEADDQTKHSQGTITTGIGALTNHIQIHQTRRSGVPVASISNNDHKLRMLDIETQQFFSEFSYEFPLNCTAISPDRRLRVQVGDEPTAAVTSVETGTVITELLGHEDYGFACDWSEDGITVATASQDMRIKIWDARKWNDSKGCGTPLATIWTELAGARSVRFSPLGCGASVLVATEEADIVNVIDLKTLQKKQTFDVFGELGGVAFANGGQEVNVMVSDKLRGGLVQLELCKIGAANQQQPSMAQFVKPF